MPRLTDLRLLATVQEERVKAARAKLQRHVASSSDVKAVLPTAGLTVFGPLTKEVHNAAEEASAQRVLGAAIQAGHPYQVEPAHAAIKLFSLVSMARACSKLSSIRLVTDVQCGCISLWRRFQWMRRRSANASRSASLQQLLRL